MGKEAAGISQIRKYLNGELDARAMHRLERQAQDDPFLMDALEGYQNAKPDQRANLDELASRLNKRVSEKRSRIIPFRMIGMAASVLVICSAGVWWLYQGREAAKGPEKNELKQALNLPAAKPAGDTVDKKLALSSARSAENKQAAEQPKTVNGKAAAKPLIAEDKSAKPSIVSELAPVQANADTKAVPAGQDSTPLNEVIVMNYKSSKKKDTGRVITLRETRIRTGADTASEHQLQAQAPGVKVYPNRHDADINKLITSGSLGNLGTRLITKSVIQGKVIAENNGLPIQGASVKVSGTSQTAKTDAEGRFKLQADTSHTKLVVTEKGYQTRQVNAATSNHDSVKTIALAPVNSDDLSETVVTGYTSQAKDANERYIAAHPQKGWTDFKKYLKVNAVSADGATGLVKVTFAVDKFGSISDIKVIKGLSDAANKKAISLIKYGPDWVGNSNNHPEKITLRIKFVK
ncbi:MAG TPA: carboxypeptidase-like regulatory domain-containing protein [Mucilaginibacter sp.]|jgi:cytoskeletal protein RodZ|nr:carboxypeptidase-like regulatory domain-containing protein [Mucilaginibacter sp.]